MKLENKYLSRRDVFIKLIESIGFKNHKRSILYTYNHVRIYVHVNRYTLYNSDGSTRFNIPLSDLKHIEDNFKKELRSIKLKKILE